LSTPHRHLPLQLSLWTPLFPACFPVSRWQEPAAVAIKGAAHLIDAVSQVGELVVLHTGDHSKYLAVGFVLGATKVRNRLGPSVRFFPPRYFKTLRFRLISCRAAFCSSYTSRLHLSSFMRSPLYPFCVRKWRKLPQAFVLDIYCWFFLPIGAIRSGFLLRVCLYERFGSFNVTKPTTTAGFFCRLRLLLSHPQLLY